MMALFCKYAGYVLHLPIPARLAYYKELTPLVESMLHRCVVKMSKKVPYYSAEKEVCCAVILIGDSVIGFSGVVEGGGCILFQ